jgi:hypothetical protein
MIDLVGVDSNDHSRNLLTASYAAHVKVCKALHRWTSGLLVANIRKKRAKENKAATL